jgi:hypothetical protein
MTERDRSAERRVAEFLSQNMPAPKVEQAAADDLFTAAEKDRDGFRHTPDGVIPPRYEDSFLHRDGWGDSKRSRLPDRFIEQASTALGSETSARAADTIGPTQRPKAYLVYQHIKACGKTGATRQEIADALAISLQSVCSLVRRLYEMGWVGSNLGDVRLNRLSGLENEVMLHEDHVIRWQPNQARPPITAKWMAEP